jgi:hypothetical protein
LDSQDQQAAPEDLTINRSINFAASEPKGLESKWELAMHPTNLYQVRLFKQLLNKAHGATKLCFVIVKENAIVPTDDAPQNQQSAPLGQPFA